MISGGQLNLKGKLVAPIPEETIISVPVLVFRYVPYSNLFQYFDDALSAPNPGIRSCPPWV